MIITEAINEKRDGQWIRPVSMSGTGYSFTVKGGKLLRTPGPNDYTPAMLCSCADIMDDWEIVDPRTVLSENNG